MAGLMKHSSLVAAPSWTPLRSPVCLLRPTCSGAPRRACPLPATAERFSTVTVDIIGRARTAAQQQGAPCVADGHLLWSLASSEDSWAAEFLRESGITAASVQRQLDAASRAGLAAQLAPGQAAASLGDAAFTPGAEKAVAASLERARLFGHSNISTEHLLLGLLTLTQGDTPDILKSMDLNVGEIRQKVLQRLADSEAGAQLHLSDAALKALLRSSLVCARLGHSCISTLHLLLGVLGHGQGAVAAAFPATGSSYEVAEHLVAGLMGAVADGTASLQLPLAPEYTPVWSSEFTDRSRRALRLAARNARQRGGQQLLTSEDIMVGLLEEAALAAGADDWVVQVLAHLGVEARALLQDLFAASSRPSSESQAALSGYMHQELEAVVQQLLRGDGPADGSSQLDVQQACLN